jgi:hypothetical protein
MGMARMGYLRISKECSGLKRKMFRFLRKCSFTVIRTRVTCVIGREVTAPKQCAGQGPLKDSACEVTGVFRGLPPYELEARPLALKNERTAPPWPSDCSVVLGGCTRGRDLPRFLRLRQRLADPVTAPNRSRTPLIAARTREIGKGARPAARLGRRHGVSHRESE